MAFLTTFSLICYGDMTCLLESRTGALILRSFSQLSIGDMVPDVKIMHLGL